MDSYHDRLVGEIEEHLNSLAAHAKPWDAGRIAAAICDAHRSALPEGDDGLFWQWTGYRHVREMVRRQISKRVGAHESPERPQLALPGFERERLQDYYLVERDGRDVGVPVVDLTDEEIEAKASEYRTMGAACYAHADELDRFRAWRQEATAGEGV
jgi:hypothetical protein